MPFRYGDGTLYGSGATYGAYLSTTRAVTFGFRVDWDNDGVLDGTNEVAYLDSGGALKGRMLSWRVKLGREFVFNSSGDGFEHAIPGTLEVEMLNDDGRYDPYNLSGPLVDYLYKNQLAVFTVLSETTGTNYSVFYGYITDIKPSYGMIDKVTIYVDGAMNKLNSTIQSSVETTAQYDTRISDALTLANWVGSTNIDATVSDTMNYHWFSGKPAIDEINDLADAAFGIFWVGEDGTANYTSRIESALSTQTITEADIDYNYRIQTPAPREVLKNSVKVYSTSFTEYTNPTIWEFGELPYYLPNGTTLYVWTNNTYQGKVAAQTAPTFGGMSITENADGSGVSYDSDGLTEITRYAETTLYELIQDYAPSAYIYGWTQVADAITENDKSFYVSENSSSISAYGRSEIVIETRWIQSMSMAQEYADNIKNVFSVFRQFPRFKFKRSAIDAQFTSPLFNLITVNFSTKGITGEFRVGHIERSWDVNEPNVIDSIYYLEPNLSVAAESTWTFPTTFPTIFT